MVSGCDHGTVKDFSLITSLRQHFAALQHRGVYVPQPQASSVDCSTSCCLQGCTLQPQAELHKSYKPLALGSHAAKSANLQHITVLTKHVHKSQRSSTFQGQHNKQAKKHNKRQHAAVHLFAEDPQHSQHSQPVPARCSAQQQTTSFTVMPLGHALQLHETHTRGKASIGGPSSVYTPSHQTSSQNLHSAGPCSTRAPVPETHKLNLTANNSHISCIRAQPRPTWQNIVKPTGSIQVTDDPRLGHIQGRQSASTFQITFDLSKTGQLRTQNLHAAVKASMQLMHRFVVRRSPIAQMGVFTKGALFCWTPGCDIKLRALVQLLMLILVTANGFSIRHHGSPSTAVAGLPFVILSWITDVSCRVPSCWRVGDGVCW